MAYKSVYRPVGGRGPGIRKGGKPLVYTTPAPKPVPLPKKVGHAPTVTAAHPYGDPRIPIAGYAKPLPKGWTDPNVPVSPTTGSATAPAAPPVAPAPAGPVIPPELAGLSPEYQQYFMQQDANTAAQVAQGRAAYADLTSRLTTDAGTAGDRMNALVKIIGEAGQPATGAVGPSTATAPNMIAVTNAAQAGAQTAAALGALRTTPAVMGAAGETAVEGLQAKAQQARSKDLLTVRSDLATIAQKEADRLAEDTRASNTITANDLFNRRNLISKREANTQHEKEFRRTLALKSRQGTLQLLGELAKAGANVDLQTWKALLQSKDKAAGRATQLTIADQQISAANARASAANTLSAQRIANQQAAAIQKNKAKINSGTGGVFIPGPEVDLGPSYKAVRVPNGHRYIKTGAVASAGADPVAPGGKLSVSARDWWTGTGAQKGAAKGSEAVANNFDEGIVSFAKYLSASGANGEQAGRIVRRYVGANVFDAWVKKPGNLDVMHRIFG